MVCLTTEANNQSSFIIVIIIIIRMLRLMWNKQNNFYDMVYK